MGRKKYLIALRPRIVRMDHPGALETGARTFAERWEREEVERRKSAARGEERLRSDAKDGIAEAEKIIADPNASDRDQALAHELIEYWRRCRVDSG
jgi:hypothetical protein